MPDWKTSEYTKTIGIKPKNLEKINSIRGKKSRAGKLDEIINYYFEKNGLSKM
jgi:DNA-binding Xre family transcriptional regulator